MRKSRMFLTSSLVVIIGAMSACGAASNPGGGQAVNKPAEPAKTVEAEVQKTVAPTPAQQAELVTVIDGREELKAKEGTPAEKEMVGKEYKNNEAAILKGTKLKCDADAEDGVEIIDTAEGAFTKPNSKQKLYLYERCRSGRSFGIGGILITEDGKPAAHYSYGESGLDSGIIALPDLNKNGVSEIATISTGTGQGYTDSLVYLWEIKDGKLIGMGSTAIYDDNSGAVMDDAKVETNAYKITVQPGANPVFFREQYQQKGKSKNWSLIKKSEKVTLEKGDAGEYVKIS